MNCYSGSVQYIVCGISHFFCKLSDRMSWSAKESNSEAFPEKVGRDTHWLGLRRWASSHVALCGS